MIKTGVPQSLNELYIWRNTAKNSKNVCRSKIFCVKKLFRNIVLTLINYQSVIIKPYTRQVYKIYEYTFFF